MIVLPTQKLAMLLPWKTASQTLRLRFQHLNRSPYPLDFHFNPHLNRVVHQHVILSDYLAMPESLAGYELAVFARNPYDRVFSGFQQLLRDIEYHPKRQYPAPWIRELVMEQVAEVAALIARANGDVNRWFKLLPPHLILETGRNICLPLHPLHYWTHYHGSTVAHFIGRMEQFEAGFATLCGRYNIIPAHTLSTNQSKAGLKEPDAHGYHYAHHFQPDTIAKINELFHTDFQLLGYKKITP